MKIIYSTPARKRGRPPKDGGPRRSLLGFKVDDKEAKIIRAKAEAAGKDLSTFIRETLLAL